MRGKVSWVSKKLGFRVQGVGFRVQFYGVKGF